MLTIFLLLKLFFTTFVVGMARVLGNPNGEFRGKLGGMVFSRGTHGATVRVKVKPTNPKTAAQQSARLAFRNAGAGFQTLSQALQGAWLSFAQTFFQPLKKKKTGNTTGNQAYTGINATILNMAADLMSSNVQLYAGSVVAAVTTTLMTMNANPPISSVNPNILDSGGNAAGYKLRQVNFDSAFRIQADFDLLGYQGSGIAQGHFLDNQGNNYGFAFYLSDALTAVGMRPKSQFHSLVAFTGLLDKTAGVVTGAHGFRIQCDCSSKIAAHKNTPSVGQIFLITAVIVASNGTVAKIDSAYCTFGTVAPVIPS